MSSRFARKIDRNQKKIVAELRQVPGLIVEDTHTVGRGFPDILIGFRGVLYLVEIKYDKNSPITEPELKFLEKFRGYPAFIAYTAEDILRAIGLLD